MSLNLEGIVLEIVRASAEESRGNSAAKTAMSKRERILSLANSANQVMHLAAHPDNNNDVVDFTRREALLILAITASAIAEVGERNRYELDKA